MMPRGDQDTRASLCSEMNKFKDLVLCSLGCVTLDKLHYFSVQQFLHVQSKVTALTLWGYQ